MNKPQDGPLITGHVDLVYPTEYLKAADLRGKDVTVIIDRLTRESLVMAGGKRDQKAAIHMRTVGGKPLGKKWIAGKTVLKQIAAALDEKDVGKWGGGRVTMYPTTCRGGDGKTQECIRVRLRVNEDAANVTDDMSAEPAPRVDFADEAGAEAS